MRKSEISGYVLFHKKTGITSFGALNAVKKALSTGKAGHTGTLDKFASGLLLVLTGRALKLAPLFADCDKRYEGVIKFGEETDTLDPEGGVIAEAPLPSRETLFAALPQFRGDIVQEPPVYSAIRINGKRASALARGGEAVAMRKRPVSIYGLDLVSYDPPFAEIMVHCSKGTYIRSLARDIALAAGSRAHLAALKRTRIAGFHLEDAVCEDDFLEKVAQIEKTEGKIRPVDKAMFEALDIPRLTVDEKTARAMAHGKNLDPLLRPFMQNPASEAETVGTIGIFGEDGAFVAVVKKVKKVEKVEITSQGETWKYGYVYAGA